MMDECAVVHRYFIPPLPSLKDHHVRGDRNNLTIRGQVEGCEVLSSSYGEGSIVLTPQQL